MTTVTFLIVAALVVVALFWILRSGAMRVKYATLWLTVGLATIVLAIWPDLLVSLARVLGFQLPANLLFFLAILLILGVCLHLSLEASQLEDETRTLAEEVAMLNARLTAWEASHPADPSSPDGPAH